MTLLHRDNPELDPLIGNVKVTREDWLAQARAVMIRDGIEHVKIQTLAAGMGVSRSSFYWYFENHADLLDALLEDWAEGNSAGLLAMAAKPAETITEAVANIFHCVIDPSLYNMAADFAVRAWARSDANAAARLAETDARRLAALTAMFARHGYPAPEAETRAYVLYYMQIGYDLAVRDEPQATRIARIPEYLHVFTGKTPRAREIEAITALSRQFWEETP